jgi:hypothetical protein
MNPFVVARLFRFYRRSGMSIFNALTRAIQTARIGF